MRRQEVEQFAGGFIFETGEASFESEAVRDVIEGRVQLEFLTVAVFGACKVRGFLDRLNRDIPKGSKMEFLERRNFIRGSL